MFWTVFLMLGWCALDVFAVGYGFGLYGKQRLWAGVKLFLVQAAGAFCGFWAVGLAVEAVVRIFFGNGDAAVALGLLTVYAAVPFFAYLTGWVWLKKYLRREAETARLSEKAVAAAVPLAQAVLFAVAVFAAP